MSHNHMKRTKKLEFLPGDCSQKICADWSEDVSDEHMFDENTQQHSNFPKNKNSQVQKESVCREFGECSQTGHNLGLDELDSSIAQQNLLTTSEYEANLQTLMKLITYVQFSGSAHDGCTSKDTQSDPDCISEKMNGKIGSTSQRTGDLLIVLNKLVKEAENRVQNDQTILSLIASCMNQKPSCQHRYRRVDALSSRQNESNSPKNHGPKTPPSPCTESYDHSHPGNSRKFQEFPAAPSGSCRRIEKSIYHNSRSRHSARKTTSFEPLLTQVNSSDEFEKAAPRTISSFVASKESYRKHRIAKVYSPQCKTFSISENQNRRLEFYKGVEVNKTRSPCHSHHSPICGCYHVNKTAHASRQHRQFQQSIAMRSYRVSKERTDSESDEELVHARRSSNYPAVYLDNISHKRRRYANRTSDRSSTNNYIERTRYANCFNEEREYRRHIRHQHIVNSQYTCHLQSSEKPSRNIPSKVERHPIENRNPGVFSQRFRFVDLQSRDIGQSRDIPLESESGPRSRKHSNYHSSYDYNSSAYQKQELKTSIDKDKERSGIGMPYADFKDFQRSRCRVDTSNPQLNASDFNRRSTDSSRRRSDATETRVDSTHESVLQPKNNIADMQRWLVSDSPVKLQSVIGKYVPAEIAVERLLSLKHSNGRVNEGELHEIHDPNAHSGRIQKDVRKGPISHSGSTEKTCRERDAKNISSADGSSTSSSSDSGSDSSDESTDDGLDGSSSSGSSCQSCSVTDHSTPLQKEDWKYLMADSKIPLLKNFDQNGQSRELEKTELSKPNKKEIVYEREEPQSEEKPSNTTKIKVLQSPFGNQQNTDNIPLIGLTDHITNIYEENETEKDLAKFVEANTKFTDSMVSSPIENGSVTKGTDFSPFIPSGMRSKPLQFRNTSLSPTHRKAIGNPVTSEANPLVGVESISIPCQKETVELNVPKDKSVQLLQPSDIISYSDGGERGDDCEAELLKTAVGYERDKEEGEIMSDLSSDTDNKSTTKLKDSYVSIKSMPLHTTFLAKPSSGINRSKLQRDIEKERFRKLRSSEIENRLYSRMKWHTDFERKTRSFHSRDRSRTINVERRPILDSAIHPESRDRYNYRSRERRLPELHTFRVIPRPRMDYRTFCLRRAHRRLPAAVHERNQPVHFGSGMKRHWPAPMQTHFKSGVSGHRARRNELSYNAHRRNVDRIFFRT